jgi:NAD+-dependent secondary alcohol dehydrogenase Adh1
MAAEPASEGVQLRYTIGHENAGWVHAIGSAVTMVTRATR